MAKTFGEFLFGDEESKAKSKKALEEMRPKGRYTLKPGEQPAAGTSKPQKFSRDPFRNGRPGDESPEARAKMDNMASKKGGTSPIPGAIAGETVTRSIKKAVDGKKANADAKTFGGASKPPIPRDNPRRKVSAERSVAARKAAGTDNPIKGAPKKVDRAKKAASKPLSRTTGTKHGKIVRVAALNSGKMTPYERMKYNSKNR